MRDKFTHEWEISPARDTEGREQIWKFLKVLNGVEGHLKTVLETGKMATLQLQSSRNRLQKAADWINEVVG